MAYQQEHWDIPGVVAAVTVGDKVLLAKGYGFVDLEWRTPITPMHVFRGASHS